MSGCASASVYLVMDDQSNISILFMVVTNFSVCELIRYAGDAMDIAKRLLHLALLSVLVSGCGGRLANPVPDYRVGDERMSCGELRSEMAHIDTQVAKLLPDSKKTGKNVALGVAGWFLLVPWFFMDFSDAERVEIRSYQERYLALEKLAVRACDSGDEAKAEKPSSSTQDDVQTRLLVLKNLLDQGLISQDEYNARRSEIIDEI